MFLRKMRWLCAAIVATVAAVATPARSMADSQILIQELDGGGNPIGGQIQISTGTSANFTTTNFGSIQVTTNPGFGSIGSLTTNVSANLSSNFDPSHSLQIVVTVDGFTNPFPGQPALVSNTAGSSTGIVGGTNSISGNSQILAVPLSPSANQTGSAAGGTSLAGPTGDSTATYNLSTGPTSSGSTSATNPALPDAYAVQQTIIVRATPDAGGTIRTGSTVGGTVASTVVTNAAPVPAPAGLVLALTAIPALGLRRFLRRKTA
jgi:hypothetical protein